MKYQEFLSEREAKYGGNAPLELLNQIEDHEQAFALTEQVIASEISEAECHEALKSLLVAINWRSGEAAAVIIGNVVGSIHGSIVPIL